MAKSWDGISGAEFHFTADGTAELGNLTFTRPVTVLRMLGEYTIGVTGAPAAVDSVIIGVGVAVVSTDALAAGTGSLPDPFGDQTYPWLYWAAHAFHYTDTNLNSASASASIRKEISVKSMRKIKGDREAIVWVANYFNIAGNPPMSIVGSALRILVAG